jgi:hypothetical protein
MSYTLFKDKATFVPAMDEEPSADGGRAKATDKGKGKPAKGGEATRASVRLQRAARSDAGVKRTTNEDCAFDDADDFDPSVERPL